ncbi:MAG: chemotaxis protein CheW [Myxococcota bacterium]
MPTAAAVSSTRSVEKLLTFRVGSEFFAIPIARIREVLQFERITSIPTMPPVVRGVLNLRGSVVPVLDLSVRFGRERIEQGRRTCVVILELQHDEQLLIVGVLVDQVNEVVGVDAANLSRPPSFGASVRSDFVRGVASIGGRFVIVLDVAHVLSVEELANLADLGSLDARA